MQHYYFDLKVANLTSKETTFYEKVKSYQSGITKNTNISSYSDVNCQIRQFDEILHLPLCTPKEFGRKEEHVYQIMLKSVFSIKLTDSVDSADSKLVNLQENTVGWLYQPPVYLHLIFEISSLTHFFFNFKYQV